MMTGIKVSIIGGYIATTLGLGSMPLSGDVMQKAAIISEGTVAYVLVIGNIIFLFGLIALFTLHRKDWKENAAEEKTFRENIITELKTTVNNNTKTMTRCEDRSV